MIYDIVKKRPADPAGHALKWIQNYICTHWSYLENKKIEAKKSKETN